MAERHPRAIIVGGGIGGLASAIALTQAGWSVRVLEQASRISEIGAGIQISPNGMRALDALGVMQALEPHFFEPDYIQLQMGKSGRKVFEIPMKAIALKRWGHRFVQVHRADLQSVLQANLVKLAGSVIRTDAKVTGYVRERGGASVYLDGAEREFGDLVVAADGVHSVVRNQLAGGDRARFTGQVAWRCLVPASGLEEFDLPTGTTVWASDGRHGLTTRVRGGDVVNFVGIAEQDGWEEEGWSIPADREEAQALFGAFDPLVSSIIARTPHLFRWALLSRPPLAKWRDGPVVLLGDAAHPMMPSMAQGAVMALEDAVILGQMVRPDGDLNASLRAYERERKPRVTRVQARSLQNLTLFHKKGSLRKLGFFGPLGLAGRIAPGAIHSSQDWIYGYDPMQFKITR